MVGMSRTSRKALRARDAILLEVVYRDADPATYALSISLQDLASRSGMTVAQVRYTLRHLKDADLLNIVKQTLHNGGQLENVYVLTKSGIAAVELEGLHA